MPSRCPHSTRTTGAVRPAHPAAETLRPVRRGFPSGCGVFEFFQVFQVQFINLCILLVVEYQTTLHLPADPFGLLFYCRRLSPDCPGGIFRQDCRMDGSGCFTGGLGIPRHVAPGQCGGHQEGEKRFTSHSYTVLRVNSMDENDSFRKGNALVLQYIMLIVRFSNQRWTQCWILSSGWRFLPMNRKVHRPDVPGGAGKHITGPESACTFFSAGSNISIPGFGTVPLWEGRRATRGCPRRNCPEGIG